MRRVLLALLISAALAFIPRLVLSIPDYIALAIFFSLAPSLTLLVFNRRAQALLAFIVISLGFLVAPLAQALISYSYLPGLMLYFATVGSIALIVRHTCLSEKLREKISPDFIPLTPEKDEKRVKELLDGLDDFSLLVLSKIYEHGSIRKADLQAELDTSHRRIMRVARELERRGLIRLKTRRVTHTKGSYEEYIFEKATGLKIPGR